MSAEEQGLPAELVAVIAAAVWAARRRGMRAPVVTGIRPAATGPRLWAWAGRLSLMAGARAVQRRLHSPPRGV